MNPLFVSKERRHVSLGHCLAISLFQFYFPGCLDDFVAICCLSDLWGHNWPLSSADANVTFSLAFVARSRLYLVLSRQSAPGSGFAPLGWPTKTCTQPITACLGCSSDCLLA